MIDVLEDRGGAAFNVGAKPKTTTRTGVTGLAPTLDATNMENVAAR